jgi:tetratricopeptide (TPR) repeat protein
MRTARAVVAAGLLGVGLVGAACGSAALKKADLEALAIADQRELDGCYDCLLEARDTYARLAVGRARPLVVSRLFETDLLLALREKELAMDPAASLAAAKAIGPELPPLLAADRYLTDVADVPPDDVGTPEAERMAGLRAHSPKLRDVTDEVQWLTTGPLRAPVGQYVAVALDCGYTPRPGRDRPPVAAPPDAPPLLRYRSAICATPNEDVLKAVRMAVPRFVETSYFLARHAVAQARDKGPGQARALLTEAYARFPKAAAVTYLDGNFNQLTGDCTKALARFDETLAMKPAHEKGLLGRTQCLSYLGRHDEAIAEATHMIDLDALVTDALYWRAWNWHEMTVLDKGRSDIEAAKLRGFRGEVFRLAGIIEYDQDDLVPAEKDLLTELRAPSWSGDCVAHWYLGLVYMKGTRWMDSGNAFVGAYTCYEGSVGLDKRKLNEMQARTDLDPAFQQSQIAGFEAAVKEDESQEYASAYNAAMHFTRGGDLKQAKSYLEIADKDPTLADRVKNLTEIIKRAGG